MPKSIDSLTLEEAKAVLLDIAEWLATPEWSPDTVDGINEAFTMRGIEIEALLSATKCEDPNCKDAHG